MFFGNPRLRGTGEHCEMTKEEIIIRFRSVICIYMQSCRFWAGGE